MLKKILSLLCDGGNYNEGVTMLKQWKKSKMLRWKLFCILIFASITPITSVAYSECDESDSTKSGVASYYNLTGIGSCGVRIHKHSHVVALNPRQYSRALCGKTMRVHGPKGSVLVQIADKCPGCRRNQFDLSRSAFQKIGSLSQGIIGVSYHHSRSQECVDRRLTSRY